MKIRPIEDPPEPNTQGETMICKAAAEIDANAVKIDPIKEPLVHTQGETMICKAAAERNANAVISTSLMQFTIHHYNFEEPVPSNSNNHYNYFGSSCVTL